MSRRGLPVEARSGEVPRTMRWCWMLVWLLAGCSKAPAPGTSPVPPDSGPVYDFSGNWGDGACIPRGPVMTLRGRIQVKPFGKGTDGALLVVEHGDAWVLSYRAEGALLKLDGKQVSARGRACDKQFEAVGGPHFDLESLVPL